MSNQEKFMNIHIEMPKSLIDAFIEEIQPLFSFEWVRKDNHHILIIYGESVYELPFIEEGGSFLLTLFELKTTEALLAHALRHLFFEARKKKLKIETLEQRTNRRAQEREQELMAIRLKRKMAYLDEKKEKHAKVVNERVTKFEIDYALMELHEAIQRNDENRVVQLKDQLQMLVDKKIEN